jgi:surface antigen
MRIAVLTGLFACALIFTVGTNTSEALSADQVLKAENSKQIDTEIDAEPTVVALLSLTSESNLKVLVDGAEEPADQAPTPQPIKHVVTENETLTDIAKKYETTWKRIFDKNTQIENPDIVTVGLELTIPGTDEVLEERAVPVPPAPIETPANAQNATQRTVARSTSAPQQTSNTHTTVARGASSGNGYVAGYCTWYVKNKRPDLPNNLGNAATWVSRAAAQGLATGSSPAVGAVGQRGNHVVYVESVNSDGTVTISEMNHKGLYVMTTRTLPASYFSYIY